MRASRHGWCVRGLLLLLILLALGSGGVVHAATVQVTMGTDFRFHPDPVTVAVGDSINWSNVSSIDHTSTSGSNCTSNGTWNSGTVVPGGNWGHRFSTAGDFPYFCVFHCAFGMVGTVVVRVNSPVELDTWARIKALFRD